MRILLIVLVLLGIAGLWLLERDIPASTVDAKYSNEASRFLTLENGARLHYRDQGNPAGPAVVLLHGSNASLHTWGPWVRELGQHYRIITLGLPGHGLTGRVPDDRYDQTAFAEALTQLLAELQVNQYVLGGNSMGGGATWRYAQAQPQGLQAMLLINASGPAHWRDNSSNGQRPLAFRLLAQPWFRAAARYVDQRYLIGEGLRAAHYDPDFVDDTLIDRYYHLNMRAGTRAATLKRFAELGAARAHSEQEEAALATLALPTLIMWGREDNVVPFTIGERFAAALPDNRIVVYEKVGHIPMEEIPQRSAGDVHEFLSDLSTRPDLSE